MAGTAAQLPQHLQVGDEVIATDPETGKTRAKKVLATIASQGQKDVVEITVDTDGPHGGETGLIIATGRHPFWVAGIVQRWTDAEDLRPGMWLRTSTGTTVQVKATQTRTSPNQRVHNLTIAGIHAYYVLAGSASVLVHNCDGEIYWVPENANMPAAARTYDAGAAGSRSGLAPALYCYKVGGSKLSRIKFDGVDLLNKVMIDRKANVKGYDKTYRQAINQSLALERNGMTGRWEVPTAAAAADARRVLGRLMITNIRVKVVP